MSTLAEAQQLIKQGKVEEACRSLETLVAQEPGNTKALYQLGVCYTRLGLMENAIESLEKCRTLDPENVNVHTVLAFAYAHLENFSQAKELLQRAVELDPANFYAVKNLGAISAQLGEHDSAIRHFKQAELLDPDNAEVLYGLALAYEEKKNVAEAVTYYERIQTLPGAGEVKEWATEALQRLKTGDGQAASPRMDLVLYCLHAIRRFASMERKELNVALREIAELVESGVDEEDPDRRYALNSIEGTYTGMQLVCYLYVGLRRTGQEDDIGIDLSDEYEAAQRIYHQEVTSGE